MLQNCVTFVILISAIFAQTILRIPNSTQTFCNTSTLVPMDFDGVVCHDTIRVHANGTVLHHGVEVAVVNWTIVAIEFVKNSTFVGIYTQNESYFYFTNFTEPGVLLVDLNYTFTGKSAWEEDTQRFWTVGKAHIGVNQPKYFVVDTLDNFTTSFYVIASGERPVDIYWNGTTIVGIVERNFTYYTTPFLRNQRKTELGTSNQTKIVIDRTSATVHLITNPENFTFICSAECDTPVTFQSSISPTFTVGSVSPTFTAGSVSSVVSTVSHSEPYQILIFTLDPHISFTINSYGMPIALDYHGRLVISSGSTLTVTITGDDLSVGDTVNLFNYAELQGTFSQLELATDSCQSYTGTLVYTDSSIDLVITSTANLCTNSVDRTFLF
jgi:hypothetical protein